MEPVDGNLIPNCIALELAFNAHATLYQPVEAWLADQNDGDPDCWFDWAGPHERRNAIANNSVWTCRWYPNTPVGFEALAASSLEILLRAVRKANG